MTKSSGEKIVQIRKKLGLNQQEFWGKAGVTQSGGSRYESGRAIPRPVVVALAVAYTPSNKLSKVLEQIREGAFVFDKGLNSL